MGGRAPRIQKIIIWFIVVGVIGIVGYGGWTLISDMKKKRVLVEVGQIKVRAEVADTDEARAKGLSGRTELAKDEAMLFVFAQDGDKPIWMKDMQIPIDIVWLDAKKRIIEMRAEIWPDGDPHQIYHSPASARYVLELAAGSIKAHAIKKNMFAQFHVGAAQ